MTGFAVPSTSYNDYGQTKGGAVILSPTMNVDIGISAVLHPVGEVCADDNAKIRVIVHNYGEQIQTLSLNNPLTLTATVTGAVSGIYTITVEEGSLIPNADTTIVIPDIDLSAVGNYTITLQLLYPNDQNTTNDTLSWNAIVSSDVVSQLPFVEPFTPSGVDPSNPQLSGAWELTQSHPNYSWHVTIGASQNSSLGGGPAHDHTYSGTYLQEYGGYISVNGANGTSNLSKWTSLTSQCINLHHTNYPIELHFYKYFANLNNADFNMRVEIGSGAYYQTVEQLTKADGGQAGSDDEWAEHLVVLQSVDEVARIRFTVTNHYGRIDPSIDDINIVVGQPDLAVDRIVFPEDISNSDSCFSVGSTITPTISISNQGNFVVEEFDVVFLVGGGNDIDTVTEHVIYHLDPGDTMMYTSTHHFEVTNPRTYWEVKARVVIENDKDPYNNSKRVIICTNVGLPDYQDGESVYLGQNEPNPTMTATRIPYSIPEPGKVKLEVTTSYGQIIYTDVQEAAQGVNRFEMKTSDLAAGIYFYTILYKGVVLTKKMVVGK